jgi:hypothetical protein
VCTPEGLPLSYEVFSSNRVDVTTVEDIVKMMEEKYVLCRSTARAQKERAMLERQSQGLASELNKIQVWLERKPQDDLEKVGRRIGRALGKYPAAARIIQARVEQDSDGRACHLVIFSHLESRVDAHILVCFLALALWRTLEQWMHAKGLGTCARKLIEAVSTIKSMDVILPVERAGIRTEMRLRVVAKPESNVAQLLARLGLQLPRQSKIIENVVPKIA